MAELTGKIIRDYKVLDKLGAGGFGVVYRALQLSVEREVVIKMILPKFAQEPSFAEQFLNEAKVVAQLEHPRIVPLYDYWRDNDETFLVMRFLRGGSLREVLDRHGAVSLEQVKRLVEHLAEALTEAHDNNVIHRDLKPDNLLIDDRGNCYLSDFGIAKRIKVEGQIPSGDEPILGSPGYLAPEQINNAPISPATDIYAFALVIFELLTGEHPFNINNLPPIELILKQLEEPIPSILDLRPKLPIKLDSVLQKATQKDARDRYQDLESFMADFRSATEIVPNVAPAAKTTGRSLRRQTRSTDTIRSGQISNIQSRLPQRTAARNRYLMIQNVNKFWIEGVLQNSLASQLIDISLKAQTSGVNTPWGEVLSSQFNGPLPKGTTVLDTFDELNGKMLILGDPGGGKTTTLLALTEGLLQRAVQDEAYPLPVVFNLSSWATERKPLAEWLVDELNSKYQAPSKVTKEWVEGDNLLLLLDGLDEVQAEYRDACVEAINTYRSEHGFVDIVVCSRIADYENLSQNLNLNGAIVLQPLDDDEIYDYLDTLGPQFKPLSDVLSSDGELRELGRSPLMLNIMTRLYNDNNPGLENRLQANGTSRLYQVFQAYVEYAFSNRKSMQQFTAEDTHGYLAWLGHQMRKHGQSLFQIENIQPTWYHNLNRYLQHFRLYMTVIFAIIFGLPCLFIPSWTGVDVIPMVITFTASGGILGFMLATGNMGYRSVRLLIVALIYGIMQYVVQSILFGSTIGIISAMATALNFVIVIYLMGLDKGLDRSKITIVETLKFSWANSKQPYSTIGGIITGIVTTMSVSTLAVFIYEAYPTISQILISLAGSCIPLAVFYTYLAGLTPGEIELRTQPNQGMRITLRNATTIWLVTTLFLIIPLFLIGIAPVVSFGFGVSMGISFIGCFGFLFFFRFGGKSLLQHFTVRSLLQRDKKIPGNYASLLDQACSLSLMRKVGGGYIFIHRYLLEYFADQYNEQQFP